MYRVQAKAGNNMSCLVTVEADVFTPGPVMVPKLEELENHMSKVSNGITNIYRTGNNYLLITVPGVPKKNYT